MIDVQVRILCLQSTFVFTMKLQCGSSRINPGMYVIMTYSGLNLEKLMHLLTD